MLHDRESPPQSCAPHAHVQTASTSRHAQIEWCCREVSRKRCGLRLLANARNPPSPWRTWRWSGSQRCIRCRNRPPGKTRPSRTADHWIASAKKREPSARTAVGEQASEGVIVVSARDGWYILQRVNPASEARGQIPSPKLSVQVLSATRSRRQVATRRAVWHVPAALFRGHRPDKTWRHRSLLFPRRLIRPSFLCFETDVAQRTT